MENLSSATVKTFFVFLLLLREAACSVRRAKLYEFQRKLQQKTNPSPIPPLNNNPKSIGRVFHPIAYGADPTGQQDSAGAIMAAVNDAVNLRSGQKLLPGISDLGGAVIDLQGGTFMIGSPITFPPGIGNLVVKGGTLRASPTFPGSPGKRHLIELWSPSSTTTTTTTTTTAATDAGHNNDGMKYEAFTFRDLLFDAGGRGGGLHVFHSIRIRVSDCFFLRFTTEGILVNGGHETLVSSSFVGQVPSDGGDPSEKTYSGVGIDIASTDNVITDVVVFSANIGIVLRGNANVVTGVHCYNKAKGLGGVGILIQSAQNRIVGPYLDFNSIEIVDPNQVVVSGGFFLGDGNIVLRSSEKARVSGLTIVDNIFCGRNDGPVESVKLEGPPFTSIDQVVVDRNVVKDGMVMRSTVARRAVAGNGTRWSVDFNGVLLFPNKINHVVYSVYYKGGIEAKFRTHGLTNVSNNVVVVESKKEADAVVSVEVDQYNEVGEEVLYG